jgi:hypothetical protein
MKETNLTNKEMNKNYIDLNFNEFQIKLFDKSNIHIY